MRAIQFAPSTVIVILFLLATRVAPFAAGFTHATVRADYEWPNLGNIWFSGGSAVVDTNLEFSNIGGFGSGISPTVDFGATYILVQYPGGWRLSGNGTYDGWVFTVLGGAPPIDSVSLAGSNIPGLTEANVSCDGKNVYVDTLGLGAWNAGSYLRVDVRFTPSSGHPSRAWEPVPAGWFRPVHRTSQRSDLVEREPSARPCRDVRKLKVNAGRDRLAGGHSPS